MEQEERIIQTKDSTINYKNYNNSCVKVLEQVTEAGGSSKCARKQKRWRQGKQFYGKAIKISNPGENYLSKVF